MRHHFPEVVAVTSYNLAVHNGPVTSKGFHPQSVPDEPVVLVEAKVEFFPEGCEVNVVMIVVGCRTKWELAQGGLWLVPYVNNVVVVSFRKITIYN